MERKEKKPVLEKAADILDLPADRLAGLPRMELIGDSQFRMSGHRGILAYGSEEIHLGGGRFLVILRGEGLELRSMNPAEVAIVGRIRSVEVE